MRRPDEAGAAPLTPGVDYTVDEAGRWVFTERHLKARGYCCFNACRECPWGQAGKTRAEAFADLHRLLAEVGRALGGKGLDVEVTDYRLGVLYARPPRSACATDLPGLGRLVQAAAHGRLAVSYVAWE